MLREAVALDLGVVVHALAGVQPGLDDGGVWGYDECLCFLGRVEHLAVAPKPECARTLLPAVPFVEVDDEAYEPSESYCAARH